MGGYIIGILAIVVGIILVIKTEWFLQSFGPIGWAEENLGTSGGSRLAYKLIGIAFIIISMMGMTGMLGQIIIGVFGRMFGLKQ
jgi:hypothetical protein